MVKFRGNLKLETAKINIKVFLYTKKYELLKKFVKVKNVDTKGFLSDPN